VELLEADLIRSHLSPGARAWLKELVVHREIASTNAALTNRAARENIDGCVCLAERQTAGRGRLGREWLSPFGRNIALSVGIAIDRAATRLGGLSLAIGLATIDAITRVTHCELALKWPNDVLLDRRKLGGILIEVVGGTTPVMVVVGVGLNVGLDADDRSRIDQPIADLTEVAPGVSRNRLASSLIDSILDYSRAFAAHGFEPMRDAWLACHALDDQAVRIAIGDRYEEGHVCGVTADGALLVRDATGGVRAYLAGEVSVRAAG
jgi:BirA family biotin operon repressor/biotin-[acetyl-CoA-carboxylase] ligase